ncbi:hypothetical protein GIB67_023969 [Kingdonia uniflora]|uniref:K Homology domain-containing protein n=1 Tax=Kingdonia uniflora TaxID=39325 RepID=A0A7J7LPH2_9MAGN|nr:hypothetical protein GIB67_023969 [Kingdonia uniflora]
MIWKSTRGIKLPPRSVQHMIVLISAKEEPDASIPPAIDGLLRVHKRTVDSLDADLSNAPPTSGGTITTRLLVPASQAGSLIGKQGSTIKTIQEASNCMIRVLGSDDLPVFALRDDRIIEIQGEATGVHGAVEQAACHLRKYLVDRSVIGLFEGQMQMPNSQMEQNMPTHESWGPSHQGFPPHGGGGPPGFGQNSQYMMPPPPRQHDNYYRPPDLPPMEKQPHHGLSVYGRDTSMGVHSSNNGQPPQSNVTQITQHIQVPLSYADAVIGTAGATISYIRRASAATITIQETRGAPGEMTVEINGTALQVQTAQQLIQIVKFVHLIHLLIQLDLVFQNYMAEAAGGGSTQNQGPMDNSYPQSHGNTNYSAPPDNTGYPGQPPAGGGYGPGPGYGTNNYGTNYGY